MNMIFPKKISLANIPTPIRPVRYNGRDFFVKRDDFTGSETSGNKIRKLEYLLADAARVKADLVITCGGEQSNHARATAAACAQLGLNCRLYLWGKDRAGATGNLFLDKMFGADIRFVNKNDYFNIDQVINADIELLKKKGARPYFIPEGGSNAIGIIGYVEALSETGYFIKQNKIKGVVTAAGTGGTAAGLLLGSALFNIPVKIYAVNVLYPKDVITEKILTLAESGARLLKAPVKLNLADLEIVDGYSVEGYKNISADKARLIRDVAKSTGIVLDPAYTGKAFAAYNDLFITGKSRSAVMFWHTGGLFGAFPKTGILLAE